MRTQRHVRSIRLSSNLKGVDVMGEKLDIRHSEEYEAIRKLRNEIMLQNSTIAGLNKSLDLIRERYLEGKITYRECQELIFETVGVG